MQKKDYYEVLGIDRNSTTDDIKKAYRNLARKHHPDVAQEVSKAEAEKKFQQINEAYSVLSDDEKKGIYDRYGHEGLKGSSRGGFDFGFGSSGFGSVEDIFEQLFDFGMGSSSRGRSRTRARKGSDVRYDLEITLEEAFTGIEKEITLDNYSNCEACNGKGYDKNKGVKVCSVCKGSGEERYVQNTLIGQIIRSNPCYKCKGEGQIPEKICSECSGKGKVLKKKKIKVNIPAGIEDDNRIRVSGVGEAGENGGPNGDLYVFIFIKAHERFKRKKNDLYSEINVTFTDAALGTETDIVTLDGQAKLKINAGTQSGSFFKIKGRGMPVIDSRSRGDLNVRVVVMIPTKLNDKQKKLLREFAEAGSQEAEKSFFEKVKETLFH